MAEASAADLDNLQRDMLSSLAGLVEAAVHKAILSLQGETVKKRPRGDPGGGQIDNDHVTECKSWQHQPVAWTTTAWSAAAMLINVDLERIGGLRRRS